MAKFYTDTANGQQKCASCGRIPKKGKLVYRNKGGLIARIFGAIFCTKNCLAAGKRNWFLRLIG